MLRLGVTNDVDLAPLFFPIEAGWAATPTGMVTVDGTLPELETQLLAGKLDMAPIGPLTYARNTDKLVLLPHPVRAFDLASDALFLISNKRLDKYEKPKVAVAPTGATGEAILSLIGRNFYSFEPQFQSVPNEVNALNALKNGADLCILSGETGMRAVGPAKGKGYFVEDLSKAWWLYYELSLPLILIGIRREWTTQEPTAMELSRATMQMFRTATLKAKEQMPTLSGIAEKRTGLPAEALETHFAAQRYELNINHLRGLLEFYRRAALANLIPPVADLDFYPLPVAAVPAPPAPPRRTVQERPLGLVRDKAEGETPTRSRSSGRNRRAQAEAQGLRVIKGGKDKPGAVEEETDDSQEKE
jgi:predicted solute-binding protein